MKNTQQKKSFVAGFRQSILLLLSLICLSYSSYAQPVMPPSAAFNEYPYPGPSTITGVTNSHNYSRPGWWAGMPAGLNVWLLVNSWEFGGVSGFAWQAMDFATWAVYDQGFIMMPPGATDLNVGIITAGPTGQQVDVSYYQAGVGHFVDVYDWNQPTTLGGGGGGCVINISHQVSCLPNYSRISMDSHLGYGTAVVWEDPTGGSNQISVVAAQGNNFGPVFKIMGTAGHITPEVAFMHATGPLDIHIADYNPATGNIEEYFINWMNIIPGGGAATACGFPPLCATCAALLPRTITDINAVGTPPNSLHIDIPDHYSSANWAYTYEIGGDIFCRIMNPNVPPWAAPASGGAATVCFTNGYYAFPFYPICCPMPVINSTSAPAVNNTRPVICWDQVPVPVGMPVTNQQSMYVSWHTTYNDPVYNPASDAYIAIQVNEDGLVRNPMPMPFNWFGATNVPGNISGTPTVSLSECNENNLMYATFAENTTGNYIQHRWIQWNAGTFKPGHGTPSVAETIEIKINPNPFKDKLSIDFPHEIEGDRLFVKVSDMAGKVYGTYNSIAYGANDFLDNVVKKLNPGNYNINIECEKAKFQKVFKVTKLD